MSTIMQGPDKMKTGEEEMSCTRRSNKRMTAKDYFTDQKMFGHHINSKRVSPPFWLSNTSLVFDDTYSNNTRPKNWLFNSSESCVLDDQVNSRRDILRWEAEKYCRRRSDSDELQETLSDQGRISDLTTSTLFDHNRHNAKQIDHKSTHTSRFDEYPFSIKRLLKTDQHVSKIDRENKNKYLQPFSPYNYKTRYLPDLNTYNATTSCYKPSGCYGNERSCLVYTNNTPTVHRVDSLSPVRIAEPRLYKPNKFVKEETIKPDISPNSSIATSITQVRESNKSRHTTTTHTKHLHKKRRRHRTAFTPTQLLGLENSFERGHYIVGDERRQLAAFLRLSETQIKVWFQNRRTKHKRQRIALYEDDTQFSDIDDFYDRDMNESYDVHNV